MLRNISTAITPGLLENIFRCSPKELSSLNTYTARNSVFGKWKESQHYRYVIDPMNGQNFIKVPDTQTEEELLEFKNSAELCTKSGLHNPLKNPERYLLYGQICHNAAYMLGHPLVEDFFTQLIQRVTPKHDVQARGEVKIAQKFLMNFSGDQCRFLLRSFNVAGDYYGQQTSGYRWPYGPVAIIAPFNFPLEIPALQLLGALMSGNKVLIKGDSRVSIVLEKFLELLQYCGLPPEDCDLIHCEGGPMEKILRMTNFRMVQFTGSSFVAEKLCEVLKGRIRIEDAGFDWKILGPDVSELEYVAHQCDQDAYSFSGQKCSAQSVLFVHQNWADEGIYEALGKMAARRRLEDLTICPVLTWNNEKIIKHLNAVLEIPGARLLFGGKPLEKGTHQIPDCYGSFQPTAVFIPIEELLSGKYFDLATTELFGPFQVVTEYRDDQVYLVLQALEQIPHNLTAGIVSNDQLFVQNILANTVNGVTYTGIRARTTGAPQNHWFGPCGDPRGAGIGSPEAIIQTWTSHREIIKDIGPIPGHWKLPNPS